VICRLLHATIRCGESKSAARALTGSFPHVGALLRPNVLARLRGAAAAVTPRRPLPLKPSNAERGATDHDRRATHPGLRQAADHAGEPNTVDDACVALSWLVRRWTVIRRVPRGAVVRRSELDPDAWSLLVGPQAASRQSVAAGLM
jgi:hypothetical protein